MHYGKTEEPAGQGQALHSGRNAQGCKQQRRTDQGQGDVIGEPAPQAAFGWNIPDGIERSFDGEKQGQRGDNEQGRAQGTEGSDIGILNIAQDAVHHFLSVEKDPQQDLPNTGSLVKSESLGDGKGHCQKRHHG